MPKAIDDVLTDARNTLARVSPREAVQLLDGGAVFVDIRPQSLRAAEGEVPGSLIIERNVLEWRFDLQADSRIAQVNDYEQPIVIMCSEGYTSSLAAFALKDLGFTNATDVIGGYRAWKAAGLPTRDGGTPAIP